MSGKFSLDDVEYIFGNLNIVSQDFRIILAQSLSRLPNSIVEWTTKNLFFISSTDNKHASFLSKNLFSEKKGIIMLSEKLKNENEEEQALMIIQEVAHAYLDHKNPFLGDLTSNQVNAQEIEANELASLWLQG